MSSATRKIERQGAILEMIKRHRIGTQAELCHALRELGLECDQATISRDVKELGLVKTIGDTGHPYYAAVDDLAPSARTPSPLLLRRYVRSVAGSGNLVVIKGDPGMGSAIGQVIDHLGLDDIIGSVAGDDTVLAVVREGATTSRVLDQLRREIGLA
jgi:transcriptional regulator of arginine metabolism